MPAGTTIDTPCVKICTLDPLLGLCRGCGRTMNEIGRWATFSDDQRRAVMAQLPDRLARLKPERECEP
jgi:uncharacterized protein